LGFPDTFKIVVSDTRAYRQFGNSVAVPVVQAIAEEMVKSLNTAKRIKYVKKSALQLSIFS